MTHDPKMQIKEYILDAEADEDYAHRNFNYVRFRLHYEAYDISCEQMTNDLRNTELFMQTISIDAEIVPVNSVLRERAGKADYLVDVCGHDRIAKVWAAWCYIKEREI